MLNQHTTVQASTIGQFPIQVSLNEQKSQQSRKNTGYLVMVLTKLQRIENTRSYGDRQRIDGEEPS